MQVLAGRFKGQRIKTSSNLNYRPTKSIVRKSIFDMLRPFSFENVLDLFSGSGMFGFEAGSRGANTVTFVDNNKEIQKMLKRNAEILQGPSYNFYHMDALKFINRKRKYDLIYADPPYGKFDLQNITTIILRRLELKGLLILECPKNQEPFMNARLKDYGRTRIMMWKS